MINNQFLFNDEWGVVYDPIGKTMTAGYSTDGNTFTPSFFISEVEAEDIEIAVIICVELSPNYGVIISSFGEIMHDYLLYLG